MLSVLGAKVEVALMATLLLRVYTLAADDSGFMVSKTGTTLKYLFSKKTRIRFKDIMILVLSGTEERAKKIVRRLHDEGINLLTTVAAGIRQKRCSGNWDWRQFVYQGRLDTNGFSRLIKERGVATVVDATHIHML